MAKTRRASSACPERVFRPPIIRSSTTKQMKLTWVTYLWYVPLYIRTSGLSSRIRVYLAYIIPGTAVPGFLCDVGKTIYSSYLQQCQPSYDTGTILGFLAWSKACLVYPLVSFLTRVRFVGKIKSNIAHIVLHASAGEGGFLFK